MKREFNTERKLYTLCILVDNIPGVLSQVARLFSRKGYNIHSIVSGDTDRPIPPAFPLRLWVMS